MDRFESLDNMIFLISSICARYNLDHNLESNIINIRAFLEPLNGRFLLSKYGTVEKTNDAIVNLYGERIKTSKKFTIPNINEEIRNRLETIIKIPGDNPVNLASVYKDTMRNKEKMSGNSSTSVLGMSSSDRIEFIKYTNYESLKRDEYIFIDSRYQNTVNNDNTRILFNLIANNKIRSDNGGIIIGRNIKDIVSIEVSPFTIPYNSRFVNFYNKITMTINEWASNSYEAYEGGQFHFIFDIEKIDNNLIHLTPVDNVYTFSKPMNYIDSFTLSFGGMLTKLELDKDRQLVKSIDYTNQFGLLTFNEPHKLVTGDLVHISGFTTPDPARDVELINEVNRLSGHTIVKKNSYSIFINVNLSLARYAVPLGSNIFPIDTFTQTILVYFASKRIQIPLRVTYLTDYS